jgi:predicted Rossmann fold nucleotide-binding protein DprA/Smf involved in DNA uptake
MFLRLNEGVPVNNAEKRNSINGLLIAEVNETVKKLDFFTKKVKFGNKRMEHQDLLLKLCLIEHTDKLESFTKKNLDDLVKHFKPKKNATTSEKSILKSEAQILLDKVKTRLNILGQVFTEKDEMLRYKGILPLFYLFLKDNPNMNPKKFKDFIKNFDAVRNANRIIGKTQKPNTTLLQFDRLNQQGAHQAKSLETRLKIMQFYFSKGTNNFTEEMKLKDIGIETDDDTL